MRRRALSKISQWRRPENGAGMYFWGKVARVIDAVWKNILWLEIMTAPATFWKKSRISKLKWSILLTYHANAQELNRYCRRLEDEEVNRSTYIIATSLLIFPVIVLCIQEKNWKHHILSSYYTAIIRKVVLWKTLKNQNNYHVMIFYDMNFRFKPKKLSSKLRVKMMSSSYTITAAIERIEWVY